MRYWLSILLLLVFSSEAFAQSADARAHARIAEHQRLVAAKKYREALALIKDEIGRPQINEALYRAAIRSLAISDLAWLAPEEKKTGLLSDPAYDADVVRWYSEGLSLSAKNPDFQATLHTTYANYFELTGRRGTALPARFLGLELVGKTDPVAKVIHLRRLAETSAWAGNDNLKDMLAWLFGDAVNQVMARNDIPFDKKVGLLYGELVPSLDNLLRDDPRALDSSWAGLEKVEAECPACFKGVSMPHFLIARAYAKRGDAVAARRLYDSGVSIISATDPATPLGALRDFWTACTEVFVLAAERNQAAVVGAHKRCRDAIAANGGEEKIGINGMDRNYTLDVDLLGAEARRASGARPDDAVELFRTMIADLESGRAGYDDSQLTAFFTNPRPRRAYEGLLQAELAKAGNNFDRAAVIRLLNAAELFRARQLREMQARRAGQTRQEMAFDILSYLRTPETTGTLLAALPPDAALVYVISLEDQLITIVTENAGHEVRKAPVSRQQLSILVDQALVRLSSPDRQAELELALIELSRITIAPFAQRLSTRKTLYVVPDGDLARIPLAALSTTSQGYRPLVESHAVVVLPALDFLRRDGTESAANGFIGMGDPDYPDAEHVLGSTRAVLARFGSRYAKRGTVIFGKLPETRTEIEAIAARFPRDQRNVLLGRDATESNFKSQRLDAYRYVHIATHGVLGGDLPGLDEPALVLGTEKGTDALLRASEVVLLRMRAEIAVLSACQTGSGEFVPGEGVLGLGRAFLVAGSKATVMSLWQVSSKETETLMVSFYDKMSSGMSSADAIRSAMLDLRRQRPHPYYWAPFVLMGRV